jgi:ketosteroid isomerase-like protein
MPFETPQDTEDAFYDAMEAADAVAMDGIWAPSDEIACLLPMIPMVQGRQVLAMLRSLLEHNGPVDIQVEHLRWIESGDMALHLIEERLPAPPGQPGPPPPLYAVNAFRKAEDGWRMVLHQNSPAPPPPGNKPPGMGTGAH